MQIAKRYDLRIKPEKGFYKTAFSLMLPIVLQNLISHMLGLSDTLMVGMLGENELAAMTVANTPFFILTLMTFGIQSGACVLVAQYYGKGDHDSINRVLGMGIYAGLIFTSIVTAVIAIFPEAVMRLMTNNMALVPIGARYARIIGFAYVLGAISAIYLAVQRSMERAKLGAWILGGSALLNIFLNWVLIFGKFGMPALGMEGAAIATVFSRACEVAAVVIFAIRDKKFRVKPSLVLRPGKVIFSDFVRYALPVMINETCWSLGISLYTVIMGYMQGSTAILAASTLTSNVERVVNVVLFAAGNATAVLVGKSIGEGGEERAYINAMALNKMGLFIGFINTALLLLIRFVFAEPIIYPLMNMSSDAVEISNFMLMVLALTAPVRGLNLINVVGVFRGGGDVKTSLALDIMPMYVFCLPLAALCSLVFKFGVVPMFLFKCSDEVIKFFFCIRHVASGKWIRNVTR
ncbi:MAG: MATE family efflux transporter [Clostridia bacterium]|nr:MATE family efflux transporter [Clostridia bacterium]